MAISDTGRTTHTDGQEPYYPAEAAPYGEPPEPRAHDVPFVPGGPFERSAQLDLGEQETRLPWLEGDDDFEEERTGGIGQGAVLAILGVVAIAVLLGALFWLTRKPADTALVADGGVIAAPKEPYKVKPENPGGEVVAGTGDTSFAVAEGQRRPTNIGGGEAPAAPGFDTAGKPGSAPSATAPKAPAAAPAGGVGVQVGAYASKELAEAGWNTIKAQYSGLASVSHRVVQGQADIGTVYRLQAVTGDGASARALCAGMKDAGLSCQVKG